MPSLLNTDIAVNYQKFVNAQSDVGRELIISATKSGSGNLTHADLLAVYNQLTLAGGAAGVLPEGAGDAFTLSSVGTATGAAFVSGTTTVVYFKAQGTGTPDLTEVSGVTLAKVAEFAPIR